MATNPSPNPRSSMQAAIAFYLRFFRNQRGLSGTEVGRIIRASKAVVSRIENGTETLTAAQASLVDNEWNTGGLFGVLVFYASIGHSPDWKRQHVEQEQQSIYIRLWELGWLPGLFQTEAYAACALRLSFEQEELEQEVRKRLDRQTILDRRVKISALLHEGTLLMHVGGSEVFRAQLQHLLDLSERSNVTIRVVQFSAGEHPGLDGAFKIMTPEHGDIAFVEAPGGGRLIAAGDEVREHALRYEAISSKALPEQASREVIRAVLEGIR